MRRLGVILLQSNRTSCRVLPETLREAAAQGPGIALEIAHPDDLSPEAVAARMLAMGEQVTALAVVAAEHPA